MVLTGRWGLLPVFPWTTDAELLAGARRVRTRIGKRHRDAVTHERAVLSPWLETNGIPRREIPQLLGWRDGGASRPTVTEALEDLSFEQEEATLRGLMKRGLSYPEANRRMRRQLRGTEAPAAGKIRKMQWRFDAWRRAAEAALDTPTSADPVSFAVTRVLHARYVRRDLPELTRAVQDLVHALVPTRRRSAARKAPPPGT
jgi:hypothetical protein